MNERQLMDRFNAWRLGTGAAPAQARPFLKWVGGKTQLLPIILDRISMAGPLRGYHEPFLGGGSVFFALASRGLVPHGDTYLSDINASLIDAYIGLKNEPMNTAIFLLQHQAAHCKEHYYDTRSTLVNSAPGRAARVIYLNKTCYNGLWRENASGEMNTPMGNYKNPTICDAENLIACAALLRGVSILRHDFRAVKARAQAGDFVYFDPPYDPVSPTAKFTAYSAGGFGKKDQEELAELFVDLSDRNVRCLLSNADTNFIRGLYAGFEIEAVEARRNINSSGAKRGKVGEVLIRNF